MRVKTLFLDAGGVLVNPNWGRVAAAMDGMGLHAHPGALGAAQLRAARELDTEELVRQTNDEERWSIFMDAVFRHAGLRLDPVSLRRLLEGLRAYHARENLWEWVPDGVPEAVTALRARGLTLVVVSNSNGTLRAKLRRLGLLEKFHHVLDSHEEKVEKPDPRFFRIALDRSGARAETTLHVGDLYHIDVVGARAAGLRAVLLDPAGLSADRDCPRVASLGGLVDALENGRI